MYHKNHLPLGAIVSRPKVNGIVTHKGIVMEEGILHLSPTYNVRLSNAEEFAAGQTITVETDGVDYWIYLEMSKRAEKAKEQSAVYHFIFNNCEHFVSYVRTGERNSPQLQKAVVKIGIGYLLYKMLAA